MAKAPADFLVWSLEAGELLDIAGICHDLKPALFVIDSLRVHDPSFEQSDNAGEGMRALHAPAYKHGVAMLVIHHIKKPGPNGVPPLDSDETRLMHWLFQAAGHRSIINQSDTRTAADLPRGGHAGELVLRWYRRTVGEHGPLYLERLYDEEQGEPLGYRPIVGVKLLNNPDQEAAFERLPEQFTFSEAKRIYGRGDDPTRKWLLKCIAVGIIEQLERGVYRKLLPANAKNAIPAERLDSSCVGAV